MARKIIVKRFKGNPSPTYRVKLIGGSWSAAQEATPNGTDTGSDYNLINYRMTKRIHKKKIGGTTYTQTTKILYNINGTVQSNLTPEYKPSQPSGWESGEDISIEEQHTTDYLLESRIPTGILDLTTKIIEPGAEYYHGNNSLITGLDRRPKIFQGTEASFVVIESPFVYGPELYEGGCGNNTEKKRGNHSRYSGYAGYNYYRKEKKTYGWECCGFGYAPTYRSGNINCRQRNVTWDGSCSNWSGRSWQLPDLESISRCVFSGNWYNSQFFTRGETQGFNFWSNAPSLHAGIQKVMDFVEGQTKIDTNDLYSASNPTGFRARIIPWDSNTHDARLKQRWLLSSDGKLATYYAKPNTKGHSAGGGDYWPNYHCIDSSVPTVLSL